MKSQINMTWNNVPHHHIIFFNLFFHFIFRSWSHEFNFFTTHYDKITCHERNLKLFLLVLSKALLMSFAMMDMFIHRIYTRYIN
jgi:hypothetical protein